ncbi:MAG: tetratricopeptide repeat protein [Pyrinomonadaceae bacterium]
MSSSVKITAVLILLVAPLSGMGKPAGGVSLRFDALSTVQATVDYLQQARVLLRQGDYSAARVAAQKALELDAKSPEAEYLIGAIELALGQLKEAHIHFKRALEIAPQHLDARRGCGALLLKQKLYQAAALEFAQVLALKPDDFIALYSLGLAYLLQDRAEQALEQFDKAHRINPQEVVLLTAMLQARLKLKQRLPTEATLNQLARLVDLRDPRRLQLAFLLGTEGFYDLAIRQYEELHQIYPESDQLKFNLALAYHRAKQDDEAAKLLENALAHHEAANLFNLLGEVQQARRLDAAAVAAYRRAAELEPRNENYLFDYAQSLVQTGALDQALQVFAKAVEDFPASVRLWLGWGVAQFVKGNYEDAAQTLLRGADIAPQAPEVYELLGRAYDAAGPLQSTIERRFSHYLKAQTRDARAEFFYAKILAARSRQANASTDLTEAQRHLEKALSLGKDFAEAHLELGIILVEKNQLAAGRHHLERAAQIAPAWPDVFYRLSRLYGRTGERARAQAALKKFQQLKAQQSNDPNRNEMMKYLR